MSLKRKATDISADHDEPIKSEPIPHNPTITATAIDLSSIDDTVYDPVANSSAANASVAPMTLTEELDSPYAKQFIIQFTQGQLLRDVVTYLNVLNDPDKAEVIFKLFQTPTGAVFMSIQVQNNAASHLTKCVVKCILLNANQEEITCEPDTNTNTNRILSRFAVNFRGIENKFAKVDRKNPVQMHRNDTRFMLQYETTDGGGLMEVKFNEDDVNPDSYMEYPSNTFHYQTSFVCSQIRPYFDQVTKIENSIVNVRIHVVKGKAEILVLDLDADDREHRQDCRFVIGTPVSDTKTAENQVEAVSTDELPPVRPSKQDYRNMCTDDNLVMVNTFKKHQLAKLASTSASWMMSLTVPGNGLARFSIELNDLSVSIYLVPIVNEDFKAQIIRIKKQLGIPLNKEEL